MISCFSINTPMNTPKESPKTTVIKLPVGIVHQVDFVFPSGSAGLTGGAVEHEGHRVWPTVSDDFFTADGETITFEEYYEIKEGHQDFKLLTYNTDDTYDHAIIFRFGILRESELKEVWLPWTEEVLK